MSAWRYLHLARWSLTLVGCAGSSAIDHTWVATLPARGAPNHECRAGAAGPAWVAVAPDAELSDLEGRSAGPRARVQYTTD